MNKLANLLRAHINEEEREMLKRKNGHDPKEDEGSELERLLGVKNSKGGQDTVLARLSPGDARLLKRLGGSGDMDPQTGRVHFDWGDNEDSNGDSYGDGGASNQSQENNDSVDDSGYTSDSDAISQDAQSAANEAAGYSNPSIENDAPGRGWGMDGQPSDSIDSFGNPADVQDTAGLSGGLGAPSGGLAGEYSASGFSGADGSSDISDSLYDEERGIIGKSGRDYSPEALSVAQAAYSSNPAGFNAQNNPQAQTPGMFDDLSNWASRNEVYSQPGAGAKGALDAFGTNFGDPHSANANGLQSFVTQNGLQDAVSIGAPVLGALLGGPVGSLASLGINAALGNNITTQGLSTLGGLAGGGPGAAIGSMAGNALSGNYAGMIGTGLNAGLNYGGMNFGGQLASNFDGPVTQSLANTAGNLAQGYAVDYTANALGDAINAQGSSNVTGSPDNIFSSPESGGDSYAMADSPTIDSGSSLASLLSGGGGGYQVAGGGGGPGDFSDYDSKRAFLGSKKKSRYRKPNSLMALLGEENAA